MKKRFKLKIINYRFVFVIILLFGMGIGYSVLTTTISTNGRVKVDGGAYTINFDNQNTNNSAGDTTRISLGGRVDISVQPNTGYFLDTAECNNGYSVSGVVTGIDSYNLLQNITIKNNNQPATSLCSFFSRKTKAEEVAYTSLSHSELEDVKRALDYLYNELGYEDIYYSAEEVAYVHNNHPEFKTAKDALDFLYDRFN